MLLSCRYVTKDNAALSSSSRKQTQVNCDVDALMNSCFKTKSPFHSKQLSLRCNSRCSSCCDININSNKSKDSNRFLSSQKEILGMLSSNASKLSNGNVKRSISQKIQRMQNEVSCRSVFIRNDYEPKRIQSVDRTNGDSTMKSMIRNRITRILNRNKANGLDDKTNVSYKNKFMFHHQSSMNKYNTRSQFLYSFTNNNNSSSNHNSYNSRKQSIVYPKKYYNGKLINETKPQANAYQLLFSSNNTSASAADSASTTTNLRLNLINLSNI